MIQILTHLRILSNRNGYTIGAMPAETHRVRKIRGLQDPPDRYADGLDRDSASGKNDTTGPNGPDRQRRHRQQYWMNSAALRFVPVSELDAQGYAEYRSLFETTDTTRTEEHTS